MNKFTHKNKNRMSSSKSRSSGGKRISYRSMVNDPEVMYERRERQLVLNRLTQKIINENFHKKDDLKEGHDRNECNGACLVM